MSLTLHSGARRVTVDEVHDSPTPPVELRGQHQLRAYHPLAHGRFLDHVVTALRGGGYSLETAEHALSHDGRRYFGVLGLHHPAHTDPDYRLTVGLRNGHDRVPAALALGSGVFVCDNLAFSGEVRVVRKHTRWLERDLPRMLAEAVGRLGDVRAFQARRIEAYRAHTLEDRDAHSLILRALRSDVIGQRLIPGLMSEWEAPRHAAFAPRTAWSLFNAFTEWLKPEDGMERNLSALIARTQRLHGLFDLAVGLS